MDKMAARDILRIGAKIRSLCLGKRPDAAEMLKIEKDGEDEHSKGIWKGWVYFKNDVAYTDPIIKAYGVING